MNTRTMFGYYGKISTQFNRSQIKKRKIREFKDLLSDGKGNPTKFQKISQEELKKIKDRIRKDAAKEYRKEMEKRILLFVISMAALWLSLRILL